MSYFEYYGNLTIDHEIIMEKSWNFVSYFLLEPCTSITYENQFIGINLGGQALQVDPKKMRLFPQSVMIFCYGAAL